MFNESNLICTMTGQQYRAAMICRAVKDNRYYLSGIHVNSEHVVSTDGHIMYYADITAGLAMRMLPGESVIFEPAKIPAKAALVSVYTYDADSVLVVADNAQFICKRIDGRYPEYKMVIPDFKSPEPCVQIAWTASYLAKIAQVFGNGVVVFSIPSNTRACTVTGFDDTYGTLILMPCSLKQALKKAA